MIKEKTYISDVVKFDIQEISRDEGVVANGSGELKIGTVVAENAEGKFVKLAPAAGDSTAIPAGILLSDVDATSEDKKCVVLARFANIVSSFLVWPETVTEEQKKAALATLASVMIINKKEA